LPSAVNLKLLSDVKWVGPCFFPRFLACFCELGMISLKADVFLKAHPTHNGPEQMQWYVLQPFLTVLEFPK
jgi:hypothetical protein